MDLFIATYASQQGDTELVDPVAFGIWVSRGLASA